MPKYIWLFDNFYHQKLFHLSSAFLKMTNSSNPSTKVGLETLDPHMSTTAMAANHNGRLREQARKINKLALRRRLFQEVLEKKIGTRVVEEKALKLVMEERYGVPGSGKGVENERGKSQSKWDKIVSDSHLERSVMCSS